jgi:hypothetical protein
MPPLRSTIDRTKFNQSAWLPYQLRLDDFALGMQDVYDFFYDVNALLHSKGLERLDDMLRPAAMSGLLSDMLTAAMSKHSRTLTQNRFFNGHPDLVVRGVYANDSVKAGVEGVEIKTTRKRGGAVDTHGGRDQWLCAFVYEIDRKTEPATARRPMQFTEVYIGQVIESDFRSNARGKRGTKTATLHAEGLRRWRTGWVYKLR